MRNAPETEADPVRPAFEYRINSVKGTVWQNQHEDRIYFNTTVFRLFKEDDKSQWQSANNFGRDDLLALAKVADVCHTWIIRQENILRDTEEARSEK
jgi:hypothetical protein